MIYYSPSEILEQRAQVPLLDVRTSAEFAAGSVPGAVNMPLFSNDERAIVGTLYVKSGRDEAVEKGLEFVGPKMAEMVRLAKRLAGSEKRINVHCWRGGMRSASVAWLLETAGLTVGVMTGGYKAYRTHIRADFARSVQLIVLGGMTGSGKTEVLGCLQRRGEQVLDLEGLACHRGSAFGGLGQLPQPTTEMFENNTWEVWNRFDFSRRVWTEDESKAIGSVWINDALFEQMQAAMTLELQVPFEVRVERLTPEYGCFDPELLKVMIGKLDRRLGGDNVKAACEAVEDGEIKKAVDIVLRYYDKAYTFGLQKKRRLLSLPTDTGNVEINAEQLLKRIDGLSLE